MYSEPSRKISSMDIGDRFYILSDYLFCPECSGKMRCNLYPCQVAKEYAAFHAQHSDSSSFEAYRSYGLRNDSECYLCEKFGNPYDFTIDCGNARVADGIGLDYQVFGDTEYHSATMRDRYRTNSIADNSVWRHDVPVLIWAPTGRGKNYFVEDRLLPYVQTLNELSEKRRRVLILVNRVALKGQIDEHLDAGEISHLNNFTDVMTYQSLLAKADYLQRRQAEDPYVYVICDEAHFFTSDAMFNADTDKILKTIEEIFSTSMRIYMTATPYDCIRPLRISRAGTPSITRSFDTPSSCLYLYNFDADYSYLDIQPFNDPRSLIPAITSSVVERGENWIVFMDNKKKLEELEDKICQALKDAGCSSDNPVLRVSADDKKDPRFQKMLEQESLPEGVYVLLTTSVLDNGVNIQGIQNIAVSTMDKVKCLQMVGRARVNEGERKTLYVKRFSIGEVKLLLQDIQERIEIYLDFADLYVNGSQQDRANFLQKMLMDPNGGKVKYMFRWESIKDSDLYRKYEKPQATLVRNEIAFDLVQNRKIALQQILAEMQYEEASGLTVGDKFLAHQFSWFGKTYDPSITPLTTYLNSLHPDDASARTKIVSVASGQQNAIERKKFHREFVWRYELSYGPFDRRKELNLKTYNSYLAKMNLPFRLDSSKENKDDWECRRPSLAETNFEAFMMHVASTLLEQDAQKASINSIETDFEVLHEYAVRCIEKFEAEGVVSAQNGKQPRIIDSAKLQEFMSNHERDNVVYDPKTGSYRLASQDDDVADSRQPIEPEATILPVPSEVEKDVPSPASVVTADELARTYGIPSQSSIKEMQTLEYVIDYVRKGEKAWKKGKKKKAKRNKYIDY